MENHKKIIVACLLVLGVVLMCYGIVLTQSRYTSHSAVSAMLVGVIAICTVVWIIRRDMKVFLSAGKAKNSKEDGVTRKRRLFRILVTLVLTLTGAISIIYGGILYTNR